MLRSLRSALVALILGAPLAVSAQDADRFAPNPLPATPAEARLDARAARLDLAGTSLVSNVPLRNVGPTIMSGRVVDLDVDPADPNTFYVAYASGGLWKTTSNGISFEPLFDDQAVMTLGDIAVDWSRGTIWAGTGENNSSRSSYAGTGLYRSDDGGATWTHRGLAETQHIGRIILHPDDPNTVVVAAMGRLYSSNPERGIFRTTDGGVTWSRTLYVNDETGAIDLVQDPSDPDVLYAAMWERERRAWEFVEAGAGSGLYKSTDGGGTWTLLNTPESGFPTGENVGRIGLAVYPGDPQTLYALLDNQNRRPEEDEEDEEDAPVLTRDVLRTMTRDAFLQVAEEELEDYLERNGFPAAHTARSVLEAVEAGRFEPVDLVEYLEDANARLFETPVIGAEVYRSDDGGATWRRVHDDYLDDVYYSYGYYFGEIRVAPDDPDRIYIMGVPILRSDDGGRSWTNINEENVHVDHHALWVSPTRPGHLIDGNDGGVNVTFDDGATWFKANSPAVGQFYAVAVDEARPYRIYGGLQDNGVWYGPHTYEYSPGWHEEGDYPYDRLLGGDGMQIAIDPRTNDVVYTGFQFGNYFRINTTTGERAFIKPEHALGERPLRFNWQTPIHLSRHNPDILYFGSNKLHRSLDRGETWTTLSGDLTRGGEPGDVPYGTLTSIDESPVRFGLLYAGSDDGLVHMSPDGGFTWRQISAGLPGPLWVSRVEASHHDTARVYLALNGYRWDHFDAYVFRSDDYGATWRRIGADLPAEPVNVIVEDPQNPDLLYVGTDHGLYVSLDGGDTFMAMMGDLPHAPVHDLVVQARERDLVVGTHGRSVYVADVEHVQQLTPELLTEPVHLFDLDDRRWSDGWGERPNLWSEPRESALTIPFYSAAAGTATIRVRSEDGLLLATLEDVAERGLNYPTYPLTIDADAAEAFAARYNADRGEDEVEVEAAESGRFYLPPGTYTVEITRGGAAAEGTFEVTTPPRRDRDALPDPEMLERGEG